MAMGETGDGSGLEQSFISALRAARGAPESDDAWAHLEELADKLQQPDEVAELYAEMLDGKLPPALRTTLSKRAVQFHDEWFGDNPEAMNELLTRILAADGDAQWAFERLTVVLTVAERWSDLLGLYDRTLEVTRDQERRSKLLDDAAHVAKDFADEPGRAVDYMQALLEVEPHNDKLAAGIERLLDRQRRWEDLVELWQARIPRQPVDEGRAMRVRIAAVFLDHLEAPGAALEELRVLLDESPGHADGCVQLERVVDYEAASNETRLAALALLRTNYDAVDRGPDFVAVLERAVTFAEPEARTALHREAGVRLAILGRDADAIGHYARLLVDSPTDTDARKQLRQLARRSSQFALHVDALVAAADAADDDGPRIALLLEAADQVQESIGDADRAIDLYGRVLGLAEADPSLARSAAHRLNELLGSAGRSTERLDVLERLATLERASSVRRAVLGEAGRLADELGDPDRALAAWQSRLGADEPDLEALEATVALLEKHERWEPLVSALRRRAEAVPLPQQRRADLVRVAEVQEQHLESVGDAIETWLDIRGRFGDEDDVVGALDRLMSQASRYPELAEIIDQSAQRSRLGSATLLARQGDIHRHELGQAEQAVRCYGEALGVDPSDQDARAGLQALLSEDACAGAAAELLARGYRITDDWQRLLELVEVRVQSAAAPSAAVRVLREAAALHESRGGDQRAAQAAIARGLVLDPSDTGLEHELLRLAESTHDWAAAADAYRDAVEQSGPSPARAAHLYRQEGEIRETRLSDHEGAARAYAAAAEFDPESLITQRAVVRVAAAAGEWEPAARGILRLSKVRAVVDEQTLSAVTEAAAARGDWPALAEGVTAALAEIELPAELARTFEARSARWYRDHCDDLDAAEAAARRAVDHDPHHESTLILLAELQRRHPGPELVSTLLQLDARSDRDLDALHEAAEVALASEGSEPLDAEATHEIVDRLYRKAARLFARGEPCTGSRDAEASAAWARDRRLDAMLAAGDKAGAIALLLGSAQLPFADEVTQQLRVRAARLSAESGARGEAIDLLRQIVEARADDLALVQEAALLCEQEDRIVELTYLRRRELELTDDPARRLELRLTLSTLAGDLERRGGRVESLRENLADQPGHPESIEALVEVLSDKGRFADLAEVLSEQAQTLQDGGANAPSAALWRRVARLVEERFDDTTRAIEALGRVVELHPDNEALDDLARLHLAQEQPAEAARWLEQRLQTTEPNQQIAVRLRLARAQIKADQPRDAIATLEVAFADAPRNGEVRKLLLRLHRTHEQWESLARALTVATEHVGDTATILAYAREAADIYHDRLDQPDEAVPVLERAHALAPDDRKLRSMLAEGLRVAGRLDEAHALLTELIGAFGRRRSPERAAAHLQLARVAHAKGDTAEALDQLERASKMDSANPTIMHTLAQMAREAGELDRAERAYRALLLQVRRQGEPGMDTIGPATVLIELSSIAAERGQSEQAEELVESALEALADDDSQAPGLQRALTARGEHALLLRVLQARLQHSDTARHHASVLADLADLYEGALDEPERALETRLEALERDPGSPLQHERAHDLANRLGALERYIETVETLLDRSRRNTDIHVRCELLLRLGEAMQTRGDLERAGQLLEQAQATGVREVDVWRAAARLAGARGETEQQVDILKRLADMGESGSETKADAMYRMAEVHLAHEDGLEEGVRSLRQALADMPRPERAARILRRATETHAPHAELLELYDDVARKTGDPSTILHAIERRAAHPDVTPEYIEEGVEIAIAQQANERAEALMLRAVELGDDLLDGNERIAWALVRLSQQRLAGGDLAGAVKWFGEASEGAPLPTLLALGSKIAEVAMGDQGDPSLAAKLYESLLERDPTARAAWEPLATVYRTLGDVERLHRLVDETLDGLQDTAERNALRLTLVESMLPRPEHQQDALEILRSVLLEDPEHLEAQRLMAEHLQRTGNRDELLELLRQQLMNAQGRQDPAAVSAAALRLGEQLEADDPAEAAEVYRNARGTAPEDAALLRALLSHLGDEDAVGERSEVLEALIELEEPDVAASRAIALADLETAQGDGDAALRALVKGYGRHPSDDALRQRLEQAYEAQGDFSGLAQLLMSSAETEEDPEVRLRLTRQVATLRRERLDDAAGAITMLEQARLLAPQDTELASELVSALVDADRLDDASALLGELLELAGDDEQKSLPLLVERAELRRRAGDMDGALADLELAQVIDDRHTEALAAALEERREAAAARGDAETERSMTLRWVRLQLETDQRAPARELLAAWTDRERKDAEALQMLRVIDTADERWDAVAKTCARLVAVHTGEEQADAAQALAEACTHLGRLDLARPGLEHARRKQPEHAGIRQALAQVYEAIGAGSELAQLLRQEAEQTESVERRLELLRRAANLHLEAGETELALPIIRSVLELAPDDLISSVLLIDAHMSAGELDEADAAIEAAIEATGGRRSPELSALLHRKARIAGARGEHEQQLSLMQQAFSTDKSNGQAAAELADLAEAMEEWDLAVKVLRTITVLDECPITRVEAFLRQAKIAFRRGDRQRAVLWARKARQESPEDEAVVAFLAELGEG